jgi:hypothetical protein
MKFKPNLINLFLCYMTTASSVALIKNIEIDRLSLAAKSPMNSTSNSLVCTVLDENLDENGIDATYRHICHDLTDFDGEELDLACYGV